MAQVSIAIGGRNYSLACHDGDEAHLTELAAMIESKTGGLTSALGSMSEPRLLLMAGLLVADELVESRKQRTMPVSVPGPAVDDRRVVALAERLEALAASLEHANQEPAVDVA